MARMSEIDLKAILAAKIENAVGHQGGRLAQERLQAERYYRGERIGNELDGRSQVVSRDVAEAVDSMMPSLMKIFAAGDRAVTFEPTGPEDEAVAAQATDYVNWIWNQQNDGFATFHAWFKDALLKKLGIVKIWWDETTEPVRETYQGLTEPELAMLGGDPDVTIVETRSYPAAGDMLLLLHDVVATRVRRDGRVRVQPLPPEEFLVDRRAVSLDEAPFLAHRTRRTVSELIEAGYPKAKVQDLAGDDEADRSFERLQRFADEDEMPWRGAATLDPAMREVWVTECYLRVDRDGDGIAELRKVTVAGDADLTVLDDEEVDNHPFAALTPIPMPHKLYGVSVADQTIDLQQIKSALWRGALDNIYLANQPQIGAVEGKVNLDDLLNRRLGGVVRLKDPAALVPIPMIPVGSDAFQMIEYVDTVREQRTGVTRYNQGLDADTLNKTAAGVNLIQNAAQQRLELIARIFAETGVKRAFRRILELVCKHQQRPRMIRLRGAWVPMDPREWSSRMDLSVSVGLGTGNRDQQVAHLMALLDLDARIAALQGGVAGPLLTARNVYNKLAKLVEAAGLKSVEPYYTDPATAPPPPPPAPPPPDPHAIRAEAELRKAENAPRIEAMRAQVAATAEIGKAEIAAKAQIEAARIKAAHSYAAKLNRHGERPDSTA
jgi:hypothetical protein